MAFGYLLPVSSLNGLPCSGHGLCLPSTIHSVQSCGSTPIPYSIVIKEYTCWWPPQPLIPIFPVTPYRATVQVNRIPIMIHGDTFTPHIAVCTNIIVYMCPCGKSMCPTPPPSSIVRVLQGIGVGVGHTALPQGHMYTTILVHTAICGMNVSPINMMGIRFTCTVAL